MSNVVAVPAKPVNEFLPVLSVEEAVHRFQLVAQFAREVMREGADFGVIPGTGSKPTLLKPGAEKLCSLFGLCVEDPELIEKVEDWSGKDHGGEPFFYYLVRQRLTRNGRVIASQLGSCNSRESKYRWRKADRVCPKCGKAAIIKGKEEYGGGWVCFKKKDGCGANFRDDDKVITSQQSGRVPNPDVADQVNTLLKMALKRALIAAALIATNASEFFTQDLEDIAEPTAEVIDVRVESHRPPLPPPKTTVADLKAATGMVSGSDIKPPPKANGNGHGKGDGTVKTAAELEARIKACDTKMVSLGLAQPGEVRQYLKDQGAKRFLPPDFAQWSVKDLTLGVQLLVRFYREREAERAVGQTPGRDMDEEAAAAEMRDMDPMDDE